MTFCYAPWTNVDIDPQGVIAPCCKFQITHYQQRFNIQQHTLTQYANSDLVAEIKNEFKQGTWPQGCERCKIEEQNSIKSKRNLDFERWQHYYNNVELEQSNFITASVSFGNTCNLKCITCSSNASSRWQQESRTIYNINFPHVKFYKENFVQDFIEQAPNAVHLDITGGEPLLSGVEEQKNLLRHYINTDQAQHMSLHYTTNVTVYPDQSWWDLWKNFKEVDIQLSIDGLGARYEYLRFPANWSDVENNTQKYIEQSSLLNNIRLSVSHTVSAYNIFYLDEFFTWCYNVGLPRPWLGRVHIPNHMAPEVWNAEARKAIVQKLESSQHSDVVDWAMLINNADQSVLFDTFKKYLQQHDTYRNTNFASTFPELAPYI